MTIAINSNYVAYRYLTDERRTRTESFLLSAKAGFGALDFSPSVLNDNWKDEVKKDAEVLAMLGLRVEQTHLPFFRYKDVERSYIEEMHTRFVEASGILGAKYIVIHADEYHAPAGKEFNPDDALKDAYERFAPRAEQAKKLGVTIAVENLFEDGFRTPAGQRSRYTSKIEEVLAAIDALSEWGAVCCWDFGHGHVSYGKQDVEALAKVAHLVRCTHTHDNHHGQDLHMLPFTGEIDWTASMNVLREANYPGLISLELVYGREPDDMIDDYLAFAAKCARKLDSMLGR